MPWTMETLSSIEMGCVRFVQGLGSCLQSAHNLTLAVPILLFSLPSPSSFTDRCICPSHGLCIRTAPTEMCGRDQIRTDRTDDGFDAVLVRRGGDNAVDGGGLSFGDWDEREESVY
jgi:hypothetical protein